MTIALGIDTGGTYTDAVLVQQEFESNNGNGREHLGVLAATKALTTHRNLALGIEAAVRGVFAPEARLEPAADREIGPGHVKLVGLSTTLATNAIVEGQGSPVCLILIGYDEQLIRDRSFEEELVTPNVVYIHGGHTIDGEEREPLDVAAAREAILANCDKVAAFAISSYFSVRNPDHELRVKALVEAIAKDRRGLPLPVTCGHELTTKLNAIRRATTVALNATLIATLRDLILTVREALNQLGITAPLMIVKGDGSLVRSDWAVQRPIETILSGPAASVVGAWHIAGRKDVWVVDVGGTTTDIAALRNGRPRLNPQGAHVGRWRTMVEAADVHTVGLGGDSHVQFSTNGHTGQPRALDDPLTVGPLRVLPLCRLAAEHPEILAELEHQQHVKKRPLLPLVAQFLVPRRPPTGDLSLSDRALVARVQEHPVSLVSLAQDGAYSAFLSERIARLTAQQVVLRSGFTPTDALHVLGHFESWDTEASRLAAALLARQLGSSIEDFCLRVVATVSRRVATELVTKVLSDEVALANWTTEPVAAGLLARALGAVGETDLGCRFTLRQPVVAVGAPVQAYLPKAARALNTDLIVPAHAGVANAIGAVVGSVVQRATVLIRPVDFGEIYRLHLPGNLGLPETVKDFTRLEDGIAFAEATVPSHLVAFAEAAGADHVEIHLARADHTGPIREKIEDSIFLESVLEFTAVGRPATAE
ncbi:MAG: hydantoinase/oxoprolinase family protein [Anaerolineae bacterium]|nr:hydantoinase/oxoprolinase family protein [Anaerolineae bacterium]